MSKVRIALVGLGGWGGGVAVPGIGAAGNLELVSWYDANPDTVAKFRGSIPLPPAGSYEELLDDPRVEGILLFVPNHVHMPLAVEAAGRGKHVWVEKPIANTLADADAMIQACEDAGVVLSVGHSIRRHGCIRRAKQMIEEGKIGDLVMADAHQCHRGGWSLTPQMWRWYSDKCPGGPMNVLGIHQIDAMHYIMGPSVEVTGMLTKKFFEYEADEIAAVIIRFRSGLLGCVGANYVSPPKTFMSIYGSTGRLECYFSLGRLTYYDMEGKPEDMPIEHNDTLSEEFREFGECIVSGKRPETGGSEARAAVSVLEAAIRSAQTGRAVTLE